MLGVLLLAGGFGAACTAGAAVFALVLAGHWRLMPRRPKPDVVLRTAVLPGLRESLGHRRFLALAFAYSCYLLAYNQLYLTLPVELERATGSQAALGWLFALSSVLVVAGQLPLERWAAGRLSWGGSVRAGLLLISVSFAAAGALRPAGGLWPSLAFVVLLTLGQMMVVPATRAWLPDLVPASRLGLYTGMLSSLAGVVVLAGGAPAGMLVEAGGSWPWVALAAVPLVGLALVPTASGSGDEAGPPASAARQFRRGRRA